MPDWGVAPAQAEAENTKSKAAVAKWMRRGLIFSPPFLYHPAGSTPTSYLPVPLAAAKFPFCPGLLISIHASALFSSVGMPNLQAGRDAKFTRPHRLSHPVLMITRQAVPYRGSAIVPTIYFSRALTRCLSLYTRATLK